MCQAPRHLLASGDVVKGNELGLSKRLFRRHVGKVNGEGSYITKSIGKLMVFPNLNGHVWFSGHVVIRSLRELYGEKKKESEGTRIHAGRKNKAETCNLQASQASELKLGG